MATINLDSVKFYQPPSMAESTGKNPMVTLQHKGEIAGDIRGGDAGTLKYVRSDYSEGRPGDNGNGENTIPLSLRASTALPSTFQPPVSEQSPLHGHAAHSAVDQARSPFMSSPAPSASAADSGARCSILGQITDDSISDPPLTPALFSPIYDIQTCGSSDDAHKGIEPHYAAGEGNKKEHKGEEWEDEEARCPDGFVTARGAIGLRDSSKRTADNAGLNEGGESAHKSEKVRCADLIVIDETDDTDDDVVNDPAGHRRSLSVVNSSPRPVFRNPFARFYQQRKNTSSSQSSEAGDSQDNPLVIEDDGETTSETGASTRATSVESEVAIAHLSRSHPMEQPKMHGCLNARTTTSPTTSPIDRPTSLGGQTVRGGDHGAAVIVRPYSVTAATPPSPEREGQRDLTQDEEDWEIVKIVGKRRTRSGYEYNVRWKNTWLSRSELGNAQELLQDFEVRGRAQSGRKRAQRARAEKGR